MESLQERLKAVRGAMTQSEFATRLRTPLTTLGRYERGANMPDLAFIINVCTIFDVFYRSFCSVNADCFYSVI